MASGERSDTNLGICEHYDCIEDATHLEQQLDKTAAFCDFHGGPDDDFVVLKGEIVMETKVRDGQSLLKDYNNCRSIAVAETGEYAIVRLDNDD